MIATLSAGALKFAATNIQKNATIIIPMEILNHIAKRCPREVALVRKVKRSVELVRFQILYLARKVRSSLTSVVFPLFSGLKQTFRTMFLAGALMFAVMRSRKKPATRSILQGSIKLLAKRLQMVAALVRKD